MYPHGSAGGRFGPIQQAARPGAQACRCGFDVHEIVWEPAHSATISVTAQRACCPVMHGRGVGPISRGR